MSTTNSAGWDAGTSMHPAIGDEDEPEELTCIGCNGSGEGHYDGSRCSSCDGSGVEGSLERRREAEEERAEYLADQRRDDALCHRYYDGT